MNSQQRVMLLIDADNVSADVMEQAFDKVLYDLGAIHVRRAYCTPESALANLKLFKALSIRPIVNLSTGKNSTDISLAVDAMDLVISERPDIVVIVSSDSDFAPLVIRLREKGCRVEGIGQLGKTGEESKRVYDGFVDIEHRKSGRPSAGPASRKRAPARGRAESQAPSGRSEGRSSRQRGDDGGARGGRSRPDDRRPREEAADWRVQDAPVEPQMALYVSDIPDVEEAPVVAPAPEPVAAPARPRSRSRAKRTEAPVEAPADEAVEPIAEVAVAEPDVVAPKPKARARRGKAAAEAVAEPVPTPSAPPPARVPMPDDLRSILAVLPELARGQKLDLGLATERLRSEELLAPRAPSTRLFRKYPEWFLLTPEQQPNKVEYLGFTKA